MSDPQKLKPTESSPAKPPSKTGETSSQKNRTWSLFAGIVIICLSFWTLHRFCDGYAESILTRPVAGVPWSFAGEELTYPYVEPVCVEWLGGITWVGAFGVVCLLAAWLFQRLSESPGLLRLSAGLAVTGRLIALGSLGMMTLLLYVFTRF